MTEIRHLLPAAIGVLQLVVATENWGDAETLVTPSGPVPVFVKVICFAALSVPTFCAENTIEGTDKTPAPAEIPIPCKAAVME